MKQHRLIVLMGVALIALAGSAKASIVQVSFQSPATTVVLGDLFTVDIVADTTAPIVGWGLDLNLSTPGILSLAAAPAIPSPPWRTTTGADGDGLVGLADPLAPVNGSVTGTGILLATLTFSADVIGQTDLVLSVTPGDLTEGFPLTTPGDFATVSFALGSVTVVPEPIPLFSLTFGALAVLSRRRRRPRS